MTTLLFFVFGGALLVGGAELLVRGASRLAVAGGISPLVVGLTVVAFGTSAPELAVTVGAAAAGEGDIALGNVVGSNIANVLLILGLSAAVAPLVVSRRLVWLEVPLMIGVSVLVLVLALDGRLGRLDGLLLFAGIVVYTVFAVRHSRREQAAVQAEARAGLAELGLADPQRRRGAWALDLVAFACLPIFFTGHRIARGEGWLFLAYYAAYVGYLVLAAAEHDSLPALSAALLWFALPLTALTLAMVVWRARRSAPPG